MRSKQEVKALVKDYAFGQVTDEDKAWLRDPANIDQVWPIVKVLSAKIAAAVHSANHRIAIGEQVDEEWLAKTRKLDIHLRPCVVEFELVYRRHGTPDLVEAIRRHRQAFEAAGFEAQPFDEVLWAAAG